MTVEIRTTLDYWTYTVAVVVRGAIQNTRTAQYYDVTKVRNKLCEHWSEHADTVTANPIPEIPTHRRTPGETRSIPA